ncbi:DUF5388 domain-containing protein [Planococcus lenghuensis]|uniref:Replication-associated protein RepC n=1 Tax=Planococcus lenghuensis TaxID=2213202 RepID=A0A1Q2L487_9BACL|nr:DUF5388 domain-containing protein [Planococcus lenghuensis]AQQ55249.1 hypothetical protein B0X71_18880 [Planococcus lenghuensis]
MSDLLRKKPKKIERSESVVPKSTFSFPETTVAHQEKVVEVPSEKEKSSIKTKKPAEKTTTVRVSVAMKHKLNALVTLGVADSVDQVTDILFDEYVNNILSKEEKKQLELILELYRSKLK